MLKALLDGSNTVSVRIVHVKYPFILALSFTQGRGSSLEKSRRLLKLVEAVVRVAIRAGAMLAHAVAPLLSVLLDFAAVGSRACGAPPSSATAARKWGSCLLHLCDEQEVRASAYAGLGELYHVLVCDLHTCACRYACTVLTPLAHRRMACAIGTYFRGAAHDSLSPSNQDSVERECTGGTSSAPRCRHGSGQGGDRIANRAQVSSLLHAMILFLFAFASGRHFSTPHNDCVC